MKIVFKNNQKFIMVHGGMPFMVDRNLLNNSEVGETIGLFIDYNYEKVLVTHGDKYHKLLVERLEEWGDK